MDLRLIEYFLAVVDHGGVTRAAEALYIAQPSLSQAIQKLEREVGVPLFDRSGGRMRLSEAGRTFESSARRVVEGVQEAHQRIQAVRELRAGRLTIAATPELTMHPLPALVHQFQTHHPGVQVWVTDPGGPSEVLEAVRSGGADLGLTTLSTSVAPLEVLPLGTERLVLAATPALAAELVSPVPRSQLTTLPLIHGLNRQLDEELGIRENPPSTGISCSHRPLAWALLREGSAMAVLSEGFAATHLAGLVTLSLAPELTHTIGLLHRPDSVTPTASAFLETSQASAARP